LGIITELRIGVVWGMFLRPCICSWYFFFVLT
jgi:hypothetical protein